MPNDTTPAPIVADALREALRICVEHNALHFGETHNTVVQGRAALASAAQPERVPLTEAQLKQIHHIEEFGLFCDYSEFEQIARDIELVHGIKPKEQSND